MFRIRSNFAQLTVGNFVSIGLLGTGTLFSLLFRIGAAYEGTVGAYLPDLLILKFLTRIEIHG